MKEQKSAVKTSLIAAVFLLTAACSGDKRFPKTEGVARGFSNIPKADKTVYFHAGTPEAWKNPFLIVHPDGIELLPPDRHSQGLHESVPRIEAILMALPQSSWPFGRVVAVQENGLGSGPSQKANLQALKTMLEGHGIEINWWPSA